MLQSYSFYAKLPNLIPQNREIATHLLGDCKQNLSL